MTPATPQRTNAKSSHSHSHSVSQSHFRSPMSPASPYTPLSLRSFASSTNPSPSILMTPGSLRQVSALASPPALKRITFHSPQPVKVSSSMGHHEKSASVADIAPNWRCRASVNGIRVSASPENSYLDETDISVGEEPSGVMNEEALLPPPFLPTQRRRALSQSHAGTHAPSVASVNVSRIPVTRLLPPSSPVVRKTLSALNNSVTATPPPNRNVTQQLKLKGSQTDPAHTRRREAFGVVHAPSQNVPRNGDASFELFDIDESDYEFEYHNQNRSRLDEQSLVFDQGDYELELEYPSIPVSRPARQLSSDYPTYPPGLGLGPPHPAVHLATSAQMLPLFGQPTFSDPGAPNNGVLLNSMNGRMVDSVERYWNHYQQQNQSHYNPYPSNGPLHSAIQHQPLSQAPIPSHVQRFPSSVAPSPAVSDYRLSNSPRQGPFRDARQVSLASPTPSQSLSTASTEGVSTLDTHPTSCSVCSRSQLARLAILSPCGHPLCSSCLTSALNIVGEKDMTCVVSKCGKPVEDFTLKTVSATPGGKDTNTTMSVRADAKQDELGDRNFTAGLDSAFDFADADFDFPFDIEGEFDVDVAGGIRTSTPPPTVSRAKAKADSSVGEAVVLRIDNVPWDITPPRIVAWLQQPIERAHVLLDRRGKTMSHAYIEVVNEDIAGAILRGEIHSAREDGPARKQPKMRGSILGNGRRARGVTVTRSTQEELMTALFPSWQGEFDGVRPSLAGLASDRIVSALETGLMTEGEVASLLYLIRSPDAHFLKVPSLPFYLLTGILRKFPVDKDSRVFWSVGLRDVLFDVAFAAIQVLSGRIQDDVNRTETKLSVDYPPELIEDLVQATFLCRAFTSEQTSNLRLLVDSSNTNISQPSSIVVSEPLSTSSSDKEMSVSGQDGTDADVEDEGDELEGDAQDDDEDEEELRTPSSKTAASAAASVDGESVQMTIPLGPSSQELSTATTRNEATQLDVRELAREFGIEAHLVQALAARLTSLHQI
ncbi:hypothetical protein K435DRAFT_724370 [Dendrothele bispora CBS 962.96]|uniref:RING-type domain-containing protein n=1 Tax=Dendrothele bispora (strain CBS 962.96) TaxID=1314807 RepID=A0A4S8LZL5_DENBC|nr:hypothetical protein K435DRAFT_724370 [Dendrothele bispora CBS 962.96]